MDNNNNPVFAYQARNNGQTYIDGILNKNIKASELRAITHNITITMVFYKLILYPKTIPLLQINFLKNLMERDEIIDLNNKIFIQE